ncbi:SAM-dependent methyltransferase [Catenuloplanes japonicus]|uniref:SAM-dependent methyltransferase n=1 Tax=Catenuloplanes japonicus TaxID=33876 RepID=UPI000527D5A2|nr:SAM-dependent methyltransferase [Catenuloplanes japonicus]
MGDGEGWVQRIDPETMHPARRYNYLLGGKDNFAADRASGDLIKAAFPGVFISVTENRRFLQRAVRHLAGEAGIDQFLDIGTGLPTADNTHEIAQRVNPAARVAYVDNDPMVMAHSRALLTSTPQGRTCYVEQDLRRPDLILADPEIREVIDLGRPVALMLIAVLHFIQDDDEARAIVARLVDALPSGSYLALTHLSVDTFPPDLRADHDRRAAAGQVDAFARTKEQITGFFTGLDPVGPVEVVSDWHAEVPPAQRPRHEDVAGFGGVARKP